MGRESGWAAAQTQSKIFRLKTENSKFWLRLDRVDGPFYLTTGKASCIMTMLLNGERFRTLTTE